MTAIGTVTVVKADIALAPIEAGVAGVAAAPQLLAGGIGRQDGGWQSGRPEALEKNIIAILGRDTEKPFTQQVVRSLISNTQGGRLLVISEQADMPQPLVDRGQVVAMEPPSI